MVSPAELRNVRDERDNMVTPLSRWRFIAINIVVTITTGILLAFSALVAREALITWQRTNAMWAWVLQQENARVAASNPMPSSPPTRKGTDGK